MFCGRFLFSIQPFIMMTMKNRAVILFTLLTILACSRGTVVTGSSREVLGVSLGGSIAELETVYKEGGLSLSQENKDTYWSVDAVHPPEGLRVERVSYRTSSGVVSTVEVSFAGDVSDKLQTFIDGEYGIDPARRLQFEQKQRFIGTIGEKDHFWQLPDMGVMVVVSRDETRLIYDLK